MDPVKMEAALERIAAGKRPDGTYNLSREACEQIARDALTFTPGMDLCYAVDPHGEMVPVFEADA